MLFDAIVLAGGRSSRLDGVPKAEFVDGGHTLLDRSLAAVRDAEDVVVVGTVLTGRVPAAVRITRESPPFGGPAAGIAAGMAALSDRPNDPNGFTVVLACDMPGVAAAVPVLLAKFPIPPDVDGVIAVEAGRRQPLVAVYRSTALRAAIALNRSPAGLSGLPVFRLINGLNLIPVVVPDGSTADVDTWADAARLGLTEPKQSGSSEP
ncbi:MAG: NTP transferase domain-containing protein [Microbacteriaceae bacterium]